MRLHIGAQHRVHAAEMPLAALRNLQTLSEATRLLPDDLKQAYPDVPWREISGFRNILVHNDLGDIDSVTVAAVIQRHLRSLEAAVRSMMEKSGTDSKSTISQ